MYDKHAHAEALVEYKGDCSGHHCHNCSKCLVADFTDNYDTCSPDLALEAAEYYLQNFGNTGKCEDFW